MLSHAVLATNITNLTDARYFAAREVSYLSFVIDEGHPDYVSPLQLAAIKEWIEGPKILGFTEGLDGPILTAKITEYDLDGIHLGAFANINLVQQVDESTIIKEINATDQLKEWLSISEAIVYNGKAPLDAFIPYLKGIPLFCTETELLNDDNKNILGLILKGSEEEKPGYKSYDHIDDVLESLEVFV